MSHAITWDHDAMVKEAENKFAAFRRLGRIIKFSLVALVAAGVLSLLARLFVPGTMGKTIEWTGQGVLLLSLVAAYLSTAFLRRISAEFQAWHSECEKEWSERLKSGEKLWSTTSMGLRNQITEARLVEERLQKQNAELTEKNAQFQEELDKRKTAEKNLSEQTRELARSKDVLAVHVQERTQVIQQLQHRYELILNSAGDGICGLDVTGKATFVNPAAARMIGWEVKELVGRSEQEIFGATGAKKDPAANGTTLKDQAFRRRDGTMFLAELTKTAIVENNREMGAVLVFKDITERRKSEEALTQKADELARSNAELEQFAFVASHDLQEPLRKIQAFGDRLKLKCEKVDLGEGRDYLERMQNAAGRMQTLINDLLAFSRVIRSSQPIAPVDLGAVTKEVLNDLEVRIEKNKASVEVGDLPTIDADSMQIRQLMQNLLSNALKFQPPDNKPVVKITSRIIPKPPWKQPSGETGAPPPEHALCELSVQDNGIGFDEKYLEKIFAVFQRLHGRMEYEGTGVGLAVCRRITDRHGGNITAKSEPGKGATFIVTLPVKQTDTLPKT